MTSKWPAFGVKYVRNCYSNYLISILKIDFLKANSFWRFLSLGWSWEISRRCSQSGFIPEIVRWNLPVIAFIALSRTIISNGITSSKFESSKFALLSGLLRFLEHSRIISFCQLPLAAVKPFCGLTSLRRFLQRPRTKFSMKTALETVPAYQNIIYIKSVLNKQLANPAVVAWE